MGKSGTETWRESLENGHFESLEVMSPLPWNAHPHLTCSITEKETERRNLFLLTRDPNTGHDASSSMSQTTSEASSSTTSATASKQSVPRGTKPQKSGPQPSKPEGQALQSSMPVPTDLLQIAPDPMPALLVPQTAVNAPTTVDAATIPPVVQHLPWLLPRALASPNPFNPSKAHPSLPPTPLKLLPSLLLELPSRPLSMLSPSLLLRPL